VPWEGIRWLTQFAEEVEWSHPGVSLTRVEKDLAGMLVAGEIDALIHPHPPAVVQNRTDRVARLFDDAAAECVRYFAARRYYPIMHLIAVKEALVRKRPSLPRELMKLWEDSKVQSHDFYHDPGYALLAFARNQYEGQSFTLGPDPWTSGLKANRANLEQFIGYMVDQRLLPEPVAVESLFDPSLVET
jgi:4,5-dihydroxyphthalate decarboxylase